MANAPNNDTTNSLKSTVRLEIPRITIAAASSKSPESVKKSGSEEVQNNPSYTDNNNDKIASISYNALSKAKPPLTKYQPVSVASVSEESLNCSICSRRFNSSTGGVDGIRRKTLRALCIHLSIVELFNDINDRQDDDEYERFPLCSTCQEMATNVTSLNAQVEMIICEISGFIETIRGAIEQCGSVEEGIGTHKVSGTLGPDHASCVASYGDESTKETVLRFRSLVRHKDGAFINYAGTDEIFIENEGNEDYDVPDDDEVTLDYGCIERVEFFQEPEQRQDSSQDWPNAVSPSPAFSPLSFQNESFGWNKNRLREESRDEEIDVEHDFSVPLPWPRPAKKPRGRPRIHSMEGLTLKKERKQCVPKIKNYRPGARQSKRVTVVPESVPKIDHEGYREMMSMKIPFRRIELGLKKLTLTKDSVVIDPDDGTTVKIAESAIQLFILRTGRKRERSIQNRTVVVDILDKENGNESRCSLEAVPSVELPEEVHTDCSLEKIPKPTEIDIKPMMTSGLVSQQGIRCETINIAKDSIKLEADSNGKKSYKNVPVIETQDGRFVCLKCKKQYPTERKLGRHVLRMHMNSITSNGNLTSHNRNQNKLIKKEEIKMKTKADLPITNLKSGAEVSENSNTKQDLLKIPTHLQLAHCSKSSNISNKGNVSESKQNGTWIDKTKSKRSHDGRLFYGGYEIIETKDSEFQCSLCQKIFCKLFQVQKHLRDHKSNLKNSKILGGVGKPLFKIVDVGEGRKSYGSVMFEETDDGQCHCLSASCEEKRFPSRMKMLRHIRGFHLKMYTRVRKQRAAEKAMVAVSKRQDEEGNLNRLNKNLIEVLKTHDATNTKHKCFTCGKLLPSVSSMLVHIATRHSKEASSGPNPFICQYCGKAFGYQYLLDNHEKAHQQESRHPCGQCNKSFKHARSLKHHIRRVHNKETRHECGKCGRRFYSTSDIKKHIAIHLKMNSKTLLNRKCKWKLGSCTKADCACLQCAKIDINQVLKNADSATLRPSCTNQGDGFDLDILSSDSSFGEPPVLQREDEVIRNNSDILNESSENKDNDDFLPPHLIPFC